MNIQLEMGPNFPRVVKELGSMGRAVIEACSEGLKKGVKLAAGNVAADYLSGQALKRRTGRLAAAVDGWMEDDLDGVVGVRSGSMVAKYAWLLGDEQKTIVPKRAKFLAIPIGEGLTPAGVPRFSSPRQVPDGFFVKTKGRLLFGYKRGKRGKFRPLFTLVKSVLVQGSGALFDGVMDSLDDIAGEMEAETDRKTGA
jgi:hypothetical protein